MPVMLRTTSSSRWRGEIDSGVNPAPSPIDVRDHCDGYAPFVNATMRYDGSTAAVTSAIAADASRHERYGIPCTGALIDPDTSSASMSRLPLVSTLPNDR